MRLIRRLFYTLCLLPVGYLTYSINFMYLFNYTKIKYKKINDVFLRLFLIYIIISYLIGLLLITPSDSHSLTGQLISFLFFTSGLFLLFVNFDKSSIDDILISTVYVAFLYSIWVFYVLIKYHDKFPIKDIYNIKNGLSDYVWDWPQTFAPLMIFAFIYGFSKRNINIIFYPMLITILITIFFTFTRSAYISLITGLLVYFFSTLFPVTRKDIIHLMLFFIFVILLIYGVSKNTYICNAIISLYDRTYQALYNYLMDQTLHVGSDEERSIIMSTVFTTAKDYFITGTGFSGIYIFESAIGSTHNQYLDTFLKIGIIGSAFMVYVFVKLLTFFKRYDKAVFAGLITFMVYGLFNSVYQQTYILFLLMSLLSFVDLHQKHEISCSEMTWSNGF